MDSLYNLCLLSQHLNSKIKIPEEIHNDLTCLECPLKMAELALKRNSPNILRKSLLLPNLRSNFLFITDDLIERICMTGWSVVPDWLIQNNLFVTDKIWKRIKTLKYSNCHRAVRKINTLWHNRNHHKIRELLTAIENISQLQKDYVVKTFPCCSICLTLFIDLGLITPNDLLERGWQTSWILREVCIKNGANNLTAVISRHWSNCDTKRDAEEFIRSINAVDKIDWNVIAMDIYMIMRNDFINVTNARGLSLIWEFIVGSSLLECLFIVNLNLVAAFEACFNYGADRDKIYKTILDNGEWWTVILLIKAEDTALDKFLTGEYEMYRKVLTTLRRVEATYISLWK